MRVVAVSDLHLGYGINRARLKQYVQRINEQKPNLILIGGDLRYVNSFVVRILDCCATVL